MDYQLFPLITLLFSIPVIVMVFHLRRTQTRPGTRSLIVLMLCVLGWMVCNTFEVVTQTEDATLLWAMLTYVFVVSMPVCWDIFILDYLGQYEWTRPPKVLIFWVIPLFMLGAVFTNNFHHLFWQDYWFVSVGNFLVIKVTHGPLFYVFWGYAHLLVAIGAVLLIRENFGHVKLYNSRKIWLTAGALIVVIFSIIYTFKLIPGLEKDYTPVALAVGTFCFGVAMTRYKLTSVIPINTGVLFESLDEGILVFNEDGLLVKANSFVLKHLGLTLNEAIGISARELALAYPMLAPGLEGETEGRWDICMSEAPPLYWNLKITLLDGQNGRARGRIVLLRDSTAERTAQIAEHSQRVYAEALSEIAAALNSTQDLDNLFDIIINSVKQVTACDSANIMIIEDGYAYAVRSLEALKHWVRIPVSETRNLRWMVENRQPMVMPDVDDFPEWIKIPETSWIRSYVGAPIVALDEVIGLINLDSATPNYYNQDTAERLRVFAHQASIAIQNARNYQRLKELAATDGLTGLLNRRHFYTQAIHEFELARSEGEPLSAVMIDIDHFKNVNDRYGHFAGDQVLRELSQLILRVFRGADIVGRYGGEEFVAVMPRVALEQALETAQRVCEKIDALPVIYDGKTLHATASIGVAEVDETCPNLDSLLERCDRALYLAKRLGRNRVEPYRPLESEMLW